VLLGERLAPLAYVGVGCLLMGILLVSRPWRAFSAAGAEHRGAIGFALLTGAAIAGYSAVDRLGVRETEPWIYGSILALGSSIFTAGAVILGRRAGLLATDRALAAGGTEARFGALARDALAGVLSLGAYLLVLFAYSIAPLAGVAPLRESGVVLAAAWGSLRLGEAAAGREAGTRIGAAALVVVGAILLAVAR
jgi:drug/metabolite transporter (DMT)-like permease